MECSREKDNTQVFINSLLDAMLLRKMKPGKGLGIKDGLFLATESRQACLRR